MATDWSPELTLNDAELDAQHVELFRKLEEASAALDGPRERLDDLLGALRELLARHLLWEERLMEETLYPERVRHRSAHELFLADFELMCQQLRTSGPDEAVADWVRRRLPEWLRFHIRVNDEPFALWLSRHRPQGASKRSVDRRLS